MLHITNLYSEQAIKNLIQILEIYLLKLNPLYNVQRNHLSPAIEKTKREREIVE